MSETILEIKNLTKYYGKVKGVENLSLSLNRGEIFGFIGPNGAGKSTTIRSIMNLINKDAGSVLFHGKELTRDDVEAKSRIGYLQSEVFLYDDLTVKGIFDHHENFYRNVPSAAGIHEKRQELVSRLKLDETRPIEDISLGNLKKVGIVLALMHNPELIIMDEPTSGLDPIMQNVFYELLREEKEKGNTVFYSTHILSEVSKVCDRVGIIRNGELIRAGQVDEISDKQLTFVTVSSDEVDALVAELGVKVLSREEDTVRFANHFPDDELIKKLSNYRIRKILIEEATLEEMFMHYYEEGQADGKA
ncbi:MAG: ABC transporter ATP-binding protein [Lachnospiraceae bacterium]|nr:ABC transporter ATP-binding protein [Lachnospiraceae bacterium]